MCGWYLLRFHGGLYFRSDYTRHVMLLFDFDVQWRERCLSLPDILRKIMVLEVAKRIARNYANDELWRADLPKIHTYNRTFENPGILKRYWREKSERGVGRGRKRETWKRTSSNGRLFGNSNLPRDIREMFSAVEEHLCDVCTICIH